MHFQTMRRALGAIAFACSFAAPALAADPVSFQQIRNATVKIGYGATTFLVDPLLAPKGSYAGIPGTPNSHLRNPLVELPIPAAEVMKADAVIVTHTHKDHWDDEARRSLPRTMPIFAQNDEDAESIRKQGFQDVRVIGANTEFRGIRLIRIGGRHGSEALLAARPSLGQVSGVVFQRPGSKTVYIGGDTVWTPEVEAAILTRRPDVIVLNAGYGRVLGFDDAMLMGKEDVYRAHRLAPQARIIASHMEAINHMTQSRAELREFIVEKGMDRERVLVPADGESYRF